MTLRTACTCGQQVTLTLFVHYLYPRTEYLPEAADPYYVRGGGYRIETCGNPLCEADAFLACRERIIRDHSPMPWPGQRSCFSAEQAAGLELLVVLRPEDGMFIVGDESGASS